MRARKSRELILMSEDINSKIRQIADILGKDGTPDNLKNAVDLLVSSLGKNSQSAPETPTGVEAAGTKNDVPYTNGQISGKVRKILNAVNSAGDSRMNLLAAVKPFLNNTRQKTVNNCIKILQLARLASILDDENNDQ